ncbi:hypothetical protein FOA43_004618 [Brettanomyces nanus]|uniref:PQ loop repeat protein n=1 Tax=Eeniella nana TaxID=13502 RepID=A0A875S6J9_EENNA|nr:uncharacterized protein FOA43_004618 [Brettanomyces nanus]QPG77211.1 hypothetical protein FOA43_004618 [Brettanomyces nanus]
MALKCSSYDKVSKGDFIVAWVLVAGIYISYVPQHVKIIRRKTSEGLSPSYLLMGCISAFASAVNMYLVTVVVRRCCVSSLNAYQCCNALTGYIQVAVQAVGFCLNIVLCVYCTKNSPTEPMNQYRQIYRYYWFFLFFVVANVIACVCVVHVPGQTSYRSINIFADVSGIVSTIFQVIQYFPQLVTTYKLQDTGTMSIPSLVIQVPGTFYWAYSLYDEVGSKWSSYVPFFAAASLQGILLLMCIWYRYILRRLRKMHSSRLPDTESSGGDASTGDITTESGGSVVVTDDTRTTGETQDIPMDLTANEASSPRSLDVTTMHSN